MNNLLKMHFKLFIREKRFFGLYITNFIFCFFGMLFYMLKKVDTIFFVLSSSTIYYLCKYFILCYGISLFKKC